MVTLEVQNRVHIMQVANRHGVVIVSALLGAWLSSLHHTAFNGRIIVPEISIACTILCVGHVLALTCTLAWHETVPYVRCGIG